MFITLFASFIDTSTQFNININNSRRNFIKKGLSSLGLINLNANNQFLNDDLDFSNDNNNNDININKINKNVVDDHDTKYHLDEDDEEQAFILTQTNGGRSHTVNNNIYFTGQFNEETCFKLTQALISHKNMALTNQDYPNHINLYIQSPGGSLLPTLAVVDEILNLGIPVHTYVRGYAASAATLISVAGSQRFMYNHSVMMIHGLKLNDQTSSSLLDVKDLNSNVDVFMDIIKKIYLTYTNIDEKILDDYFYHDKWMNSTLALEYGLIDEIL